MQKPGSGKLPVFFWIHGGAFQTGDCTIARCGPQYLMDHEIVVVTVQYRLGPLGNSNLSVTVPAV